MASSSSSSSSSGATCYYPNGSPSQENDIPCGSGSGVGCCPSGWTCQNNGLCYLANENYYGRYTCTDKTWKSTGCPQICTHGNTASGNEAVLECSTGSYCCDANRPNPGCCDTSTSRFAINNGQQVAIGGGGASSSTSISSPSNKPAPASSSTSTTSSNTPSATPTTSSTFTTPKIQSATAASSSSTPSSSTPSTSLSNPDVAIFTTIISQPSNAAQSGTTVVITSTPQIASETATSQPTPTPAPKSKNSASTIAPAVAVPIAVLALAALAFLLFRRRRRNRARTSPGVVDPDTLESMYKTKPPLDSPYAGKSELDGSVGNKSPNGVAGSTAPPSYRGVSGVMQSPNAELSGIPIEVGPGELDGGGSAHTGAATALGISTSSPQPDLPETPTGSMAGEGNAQHSELPGSTYHAYRPPGGVVS